MNSGSKRKRALAFRRLKYERRQASARLVHTKREQIKRGDRELNDASVGWNAIPIPWWTKARNFILRRDRKTCRRCGVVKKRSELEVHHIIPRKYGGDERHLNLISLCGSCHRKTEFALMNSGLFDTDWRRYEFSDLWVRAMKACGLAKDLKVPHAGKSASQRSRRPKRKPRG